MTVPLTPIPARVADLRGDVSPVAPTSGQVHAWNSSTAKWTPQPVAGSITGLLKASAGVPAQAVASTDYSVPSAVETFTGGKYFLTNQTTAPAVFGDDASFSLKQTRNGSMVGNAAWTIFNEGVAFPYYLETYFSDDGGLFSGRYGVFNQLRNDNGSVQTVAEQGMLDVCPDGNFGALNAQSGLAHSGANAYILSARNFDDLDANWPSGLYSIGAGKKRGVIGPDLELIWGASLLLNPDANRYAKLYLDRTLTEPTMRLVGSTSVSPFSGFVDLTAPVRLPNNQALKAELGDASVVDLLYQNGGVVNLGYPTASGAYLRVGASGFIQLVDNAFNPAMYIQFPSKAAVFYGSLTAPSFNPTTRPTVTGSRGGNAALASLLTGLAGVGLLTDSTTA